MIERQAPALSASPLPTGASASPDISRTLSAMDKLGQKVAGYTGVLERNYKKKQQADANADYYAGQVNEQEVENDSTYARTIAYNEHIGKLNAFSANLDKYTTKNSAEFDEILEDTYKQTTDGLRKSEFGQVLTDDYGSLWAEYMPKLVATQAKAHKDYVRKKTVEETTTSLVSMMTSGGDFAGNLESYSVWNTFNKHDQDAIMMEAVDESARMGSKVGLDYAKDTLGVDPDYATKYLSAQTAYTTKQHEINRKYITDKIRTMEGLADAGLYTKQHTEAYYADTKLQNEYTDKQLIALENRSRGNSFKNANVNQYMNIIKAGERPYGDDSEINKAHDSIYDEFMLDRSPSEAMLAYSTLVGTSGGRSKNFITDVQRALRAGLSDEPTLPSDELVSALSVYSDAIDNGTTATYGLSVAEDGALRAGVDVFKQTRTVNTKTDASGLFGTALHTARLYLQKSKDGSLPKDVLDSKEIDKHVQSFLDTYSKQGTFMWFGTEKTIPEDLAEEIKQNVYTLSLTQPTADPSILAQQAGALVLDGISTFDNVYRTLSVPLEQTLGVDREVLPLVKDWLMEQEDVLALAGDSDAQDLLTDFYESEGVTYMTVSTLDGQQLVYKAKELGASYNKDQQKIQTLNRQTQITKAQEVLLEAKRAKESKRNKFIWDNSPEMRKVYYSLPNEYKDIYVGAYEIINDSFDKTLWESLSIAGSALALGNPVTMAYQVYDKGFAGALDTVSTDKLKELDKQREVAWQVIADIGKAYDLTYSDTALRKALRCLPDGEWNDMLQPAFEDAVGTDTTAKARVASEIENLSTLLIQSPMVAMKIPTAVTEQTVITGAQKVVMKNGDIPEAEVEQYTAFRQQFEHLSGFEGAMGYEWADTLAELKASPSEGFKRTYNRMLAKDSKLDDTSYQRYRESFMGINRFNNPKSEIWDIIDPLNDSGLYKTREELNGAYKRLATDGSVRKVVADYYYNDYYKKNNLHKLDDTFLSGYMLDFSVHSGVGGAARSTWGVLKDMGYNSIPTYTKTPLTTGAISFINNHSKEFALKIKSTRETYVKQAAPNTLGRVKSASQTYK